MGYPEARELARIRYELRQYFLQRRHRDAAGCLQRLHDVAENEEIAALGLRGEYRRWKLRFELLERQIG